MPINQASSGGGFTPPAAPPVTGESGLYMAGQVLPGGNPSDGAQIPSWYDRSGGGNPLVFLSSPAPTYSKTGGPNGLPAVVFGTGLGMGSTKAFVTSSGFTVSWTGAFTDPTQDGYVLCFGDGADPITPGISLALFSQGGALQVMLGSVPIGTPVALDTNWHEWLLLVDVAGSVINLYMDGGNVVPDGVTTGINIGDSLGYTLGCGNGFQAPVANSAPMSIFEAAFYPFLFSTTQFANQDLWYGGIGTDAPLTAIDPVGGMTYNLRLQTCVPGSVVPLGLFQDAAGTVPATTATQLVKNWTDELKATNSGSQTSTPSAPSLAFDSGSGAPYVAFVGASQTNLALASNLVTGAFFDVFMLVKVGSVQTVSYLLGGSSQGFYPASQPVAGNGPGEFDGANLRSGNANLSTGWHVIEYQPINIYVDGVEVTYSNSGTIGSVTASLIGAEASNLGFAFDGGCIAIAAFPGVFNSYSRALFLKYLQALL